MQHAGPHELVIPETGAHARRNGTFMHNTRDFVYPSENSFILRHVIPRLWPQIYMRVRFT